MEIKEFLSYFKKVHASGNNQYTALCPAHDDKHPSLSIGFSTENNHIVLCCHAGCKAEDVLSSVGLSFKDLYSDDKRSKIMNKVTYTYYKHNGEMAYKKYRTDYNDGSKKFYFETPNGTKKLTGVQRELYNLPNVLKATKVYFVEGEKCADEIIRYGAVATTLDSGAKSHWYPHYNEYLNGKEIIIIPDNDIPGINYAKMILQNIPTAKIVNLPDLPKKGDIFDWLAMGHTMQEVDELPEFKFPEDTETNIANNITDTAFTDPFRKETQAETIIHLTEEKEAIFFHDKLKMTYVAVMNNGHREVWHIDSEIFDYWLKGLYFLTKGKAANKDSVQQAKEIFKVKALFENTKAIPLETRVSKSENALWYNLCN